ncbi:MAG: hypothetical protein PVH77_03795 [Phycisphaerales bacterium]|jgi:hypothetical protein
MPDLFINDYIDKITFLEKQLGAYVGYKPMEPFWVSGKGFMDSLRLQGAAKEIADFLGLSQYTFLITATKQKLDTAGNIELKYSGNDVFVEISEDVQGFEDAVIATLAHELTHKYMQVNGISLGTNTVQKYENEVLTDITTIFLGLGKFLLNGCNNERTYTEYRGADKYEVTKTMKVGYLTQRQMAFVYRLVCSMRGISKEDMLSNLDLEAKDAVMGCEHYTEEYFNSDFKSENYRKKIADVASKQLSQLQNSLDEVEEEMNFVESMIRELSNGIQIIKGKIIIPLRSELEHITKSSSHDPCMKFLEGIKIEQWKNLLISTVSGKHKEVRNLRKAVRRLRRASRKEFKVSGKKRESKFRIIVVMVIGLAILLGLAILYLIKKT